MNATRDEAERSYLLKRAIHEALDARERGDGPEGESLSVGYGKAWAKAQGRNVLLAFTIIVPIAFVAYLVYKSTEDMSASHARIEALQKTENDNAEAMMYITWVCRKADAAAQAECDKLNLTRPRKIVEMQRNQ